VTSSPCCIPPYTAWHLSYVALGAAAAPHVHLDRLGAALGAFALAVGLSAHALDELHGRPLQTRLSRRVLIALAVAPLLGAVAIGVVGMVVVSPLLAPLVLAGGLLVPAYNLELAGGRVHTDTWFALAWGGFPAFTGYFVNSLTIRPAGVLVAAACCLLTVAQRRLSAPARQLRRRPLALEGGGCAQEQPRLRRPGKRPPVGLGADLLRKTRRPVQRPGKSAGANGPPLLLLWHSHHPRTAEEFVQAPIAVAGTHSAEKEPDPHNLQRKERQKFK